MLMIMRLVSYPNLETPTLETAPSSLRSFENSSEKLGNFWFVQKLDGVAQLVADTPDADTSNS